LRIVFLNCLVVFSVALILFQQSVHTHRYDITPPHFFPAVFSTCMCLCLPLYQVTVDPISTIVYLYN